MTTTYQHLNWRDGIDQSGPHAPLYGYDGRGYTVGDRVEIHPSTHLWQRGARYGVVIRVTQDDGGRLVHVKLDKYEHVWRGREDMLRNQA